MTTITEYTTLKIADHLPAAIENFDYSGLDEHETDQLISWLDDLPSGAALTYEFPHDDFTECDITGMPANCATVTIWEVS